MATRTDNQHGRIVVINDVEKHVARILCVPGLTCDGNM